MKQGIEHRHLWDELAAGEAQRLMGPILIIGATGFIGANLYYSLAKYRDDVFACSRNPRFSWRLASVGASKLVSLDITNYKRVMEVIRFLKPRTVFNVSAYGGYERQNFVSTIHATNYMGTLNLLRALYETGCDAFVHSGSSSEYGLNCSAPSENDELKPNSDYAVSKVGAGYLVKFYGLIHQLPCVNLRLFSIYGPWEERDRLIPTLIQNGLQGRYPYFADREISRDFVYIDDCTAAMVHAAVTACKTHRGSSLNIASGVKTTLEEVAMAAQAQFAITDAPLFGSMPNRKWDLRNWYGDTRTVEKVMGWRSKVPFKEGLALTVAWEKQYQEKLRFVMVPQKKKKISAIIACYRDNQSIPILHEQLTSVFVATGYDYEIIFVNDRSPHNDEEVIANLTRVDPHVIGVSHSRNFGSQSAFMSGLEIASGDAAVFLDGDGQDPPAMIGEFAKKWEEGFDIVYGERTSREASWYMQGLYKLFYRIFSKLADVKIPIDAGDFSLIDRKVISHLLKFTEKDLFLRGLRAWVGYKQTGVPYKRPERMFGKSTNNFGKNIWWAKKAIFSFSTKPINYIQSVGVFIFLFAGLLALFYLITYLVNPPKDAPGITTIILLVLGLGSIQIISISILGDYIGKIIEEVKNRPRFIRSKVLYHGDEYATEESMSQVIGELQKLREMEL